MRKAVIAFSLVLVCTLVSAQTNEEKAIKKTKDAIDLMDSGLIKESIKLLEEAEALDPGKFMYTYEKSYAHYIDKDYKGTIKILEKLKSHPDASERLYQLLGNSYDLIEKPEKAFDAYDEGLKKFPNAGMLFLEKGNVYWEKKDYGKALPLYEKGIEMDPAFPSNYYRAALLYANSDNPIWGLIYGELFMNLERNSKRTAEISALLYKIYNDAIVITGDSSASHFCKIMTISTDALKKDGTMRLPYCFVFEPTMLVALVLEKTKDIHTLNRIRQRFVTRYFAAGYDKEYPNVLFAYQNDVQNAGHLEAYNYWILMKGDEAAFTTWQDANASKWNDFIAWFKTNGLKLDATHKLTRAQLE